MAMKIVQHSDYPGTLYENPNALECSSLAMRHETIFAHQDF